MKLDAQVVQELQVLVLSGFESRDRMIEILCEERYAPGELDRDEMSAALDVALEQLQRESESWPPVTDCDRLEAAFAAMRARGLVALQNAGYTQSDGYDDVLDFVERQKQRDRWVGYCFYHGQDLERAVAGDGLYLAFGPLDPKQEESAGPGIGRCIVEEIERAGLQAEWDGTFKQRIFIPKLDWKLRRGAGVVAKIAVAIRQAVAGGENLCATFAIAGDPDRWVQFAGDVINARWPRWRNPGPVVAKLGNAVVESYKMRRYVTARLQAANTLAIAHTIDAYFRQVLEAGQDYSVDVNLQWI